ncbi:MAG: hypothetical protein KC591_02190 [Gemmatimonadetes bacterium]|nr:hypothetical protein [Gemmatimonadota bacterium]
MNGTNLLRTFAFVLLGTILTAPAAIADPTLRAFEASSDLLREPGDSPAALGAPLFTDGFESGLGQWTVTDLSGAGAQWSDWDCWAASGSRSAGCAAGGSAAIACGENYPDDMKTWMVAGPFDLTAPGVQAAELEFQLKLRCEPYLDRFFVGTSVDGIDFFGHFWDSSTDETVVIDVTDQVGTDAVWIGFLFLSDGSSGRVEGAQVDDVELRALLPSAHQFGWTISASLSDPYVNSGTPQGVPGIVSRQLWFACQNQSEGFYGASFGIECTAGTYIGLTTTNGFLNAGTMTEPVFAAGGCPLAPIRVATLTFFDTGTDEGIRACIVPNSNGENFTLDCSGPPYLAYPNDYIGFDGTGAMNPCTNGTPCESGPVSVGTTSWSEIKALYR